MRQKVYASLTAGRTLINCSPVQFEQFTNPEVRLPRGGLIEEVAEKLGYKIEELQGLWYVHNAEGLRFAEAEASRRSAVTTWWKKVGLAELIEYRREHRDFDQMPRQGRPATGDQDGNRRASSTQRSVAKNNIYIRLETVWMDAKSILVRHSPQAEVWLDMAVQQDIPRRHSTRRIGERRAVLEALAHLYDVDKMNKEIHALLNGGTADDEVISQALMAEFPQLGCWGEVGGVMPRMALMTALQLSEYQPSVLFKELHAVLGNNGMQDTEELKHLIQLVLE